MRTRPFRVSRLQLARAAASVYARKAWWLMLPFPIFGIWLLATADDRLLKYIGFVALFWPLTIPARAVLVTRKASQRLLQETVAILDEEALYLQGEDGRGTKVPLDRITGLRRSMGLFVVELKHYVFVLVPLDAFESEADEAEFEQRVRSAIAASRD